MTFAVDQQDSPAIHDPLQIARQTGQLVLTGQRQGLRLVLNVGRQASATVYLTI